MEKIISDSYNLLIGRGEVILGKNLAASTDPPIWAAISIEDKDGVDSLDPGYHVMTVEEVILDYPTWYLLFDHLVRASCTWY